MDRWIKRLFRSPARGSGRRSTRTVIDLGGVVVHLPPGGDQRLIEQALSADHHLRFVRELQDPDLATT